MFAIFYSVDWMGYYSLLCAYRRNELVLDESIEFHILFFIIFVTQSDSIQFGGIRALSTFPLSRNYYLGCVITINFFF